MRKTYRPVSSLSIVTPPASEPVDLSSTKLYLRVDGSTEDTLIGGMISAARMSAEKYLRRSLITQIWKLTYEEYAPCVMPLPLSPVQSLNSVTLVARDGTETAVNSSSYRLAAGNTVVVMEAALLASRVELVYTAGYGNAAAVPDAIKQGILAHVAALYEGRGESSALPAMAEALYRPYKILVL